VESEQEGRRNGSQLLLFHQLTSLRHHKALHSGKVYFPFSNINIFSFIRSVWFGGCTLVNLEKLLSNKTRLSFAPILKRVPGFILSCTLTRVGRCKKDSLPP